MNDKKTIKKILFGLLIAIALLVVYSVLVPQDDSQTAQGSSSLSSLLDDSSLGQIKEADTKVANAEILKILGNIQHIELRDDIFSNPVFRKLEDSEFTIPKPVVIGRPNPFLPIGYDIILNTQKQNDIIIDDNNSGWNDGDFGDFDDLSL